MDRIGQRLAWGLIDEQVHMLGHDHVSVDTHREPAAHPFETEYKEIVIFGAREIWATITAERNEVGLSGLMEAPEIAGHRREITPVRSKHAVTYIPRLAQKRGEPGAPQQI
jgi:hypothetical protein